MIHFRKHGHSAAGRASGPLHPKKAPRIAPGRLTLLNHIKLFLNHILKHRHRQVREESVVLGGIHQIRLAVVVDRDDRQLLLQNLLSLVEVLKALVLGGSVCGCADVGIILSL